MQFRQFSKQIMQAALVLLCIFSVSGLSAGPKYDKRGRNVKDASVYAQLSSSQTQLPGINTAATVAMEHVDALAGIAVHNDKIIEILEEGVYVITANVMAGNNGLGVHGGLNLWLNHNSEVLKHTVVYQTVQSDVDYGSTVSTQSVAKLKKGDQISVGIAVTSPLIGLISSSDILNSNQTSSVLFTVYKIGS